MINFSNPLSLPKIANDIKIDDPNKIFNSTTS